MTKRITVEKVRVIDCRAVRGFLGTPVDGSVANWGYRGAVCEYPNTGTERYDAGAGVAYAFNDNDGLHITLADGNGFDLVVLRGGARSRMYVDGPNLTEPDDATPVHYFRGGAPVETARFDTRVQTAKVSFFGTDAGTLADIGFYRISHGDREGGECEAWVPEGDRIRLQPPATEFAPESLYLAMKEGYGLVDYHPMKAGLSGSPVAVAGDRILHMITPPTSQDRGLDFVALDMVVSGVGEFSCTVVVKDPLNPRLDLMHVPLRGEGAVSYRLHLDVPAQVLFAGSRLWIALELDRDATVSGPNGGGPQLLLHHAPKETVSREAFAHRMFLLRSFFCILSEARQWGSYRRQSRQELFAQIRFGRQYAELFMTVDQCHALHPEHDTLRQYREWIYLRHLDGLSEVSAPPGPPDGVPAWAWYPRQGWLEVRRIVEWWLDNRLVPTGEIGGIVGDDSDFYQQVADLPYIEVDGVGGRLRDAAARFAELAVKENLKGGINILTTDGLHAYEEGINHLALVARWFYGDPIHFERCLESARNMQKLTVVTADGRRHFRSTRDLGIRTIEHPGEPGSDGGWAALMWHTTLQAADYNRNPKTLEVLSEWADTWLKYMKPGYYASSIDVSSGEVLQASDTRPFDAKGQVPVFVWLYALTGETRFIEPLLLSLQQSRAMNTAQSLPGELYNLGALHDLPPKVIESLCASNPLLHLYRTRDAGPILDRIVGDPTPSGSAIASLYDAQRWPDMYTRVEQYTDRIFFNRLLENVSLCYLGGYCGRGNFNPTTAISWEGYGTDFGALVLENRPDRLTVAAYSYADAPLEGVVRVWALEHGRYRITSGLDADGDFSMDSTRVVAELELARADVVPLTLHPKAVTILRIEQIEGLEPIYLRPDLAVTARELTVVDGTVTGIVHNIGSAAVEDVVIGIVDGEAAILAQQSLGRLDAPCDLLPKRLTFSLSLPAGVTGGLKLKVDPENRIPELYEGNNTVELDSLPQR